MITDAELARERRQLRLSREEPVRSAFDDEPVHLFGHDHTAGAALAFEQGDVAAAALRQLPRGGEPGDAGTDDDDLHAQPRSAAALRTTSATAATRPGSALSDGQDRKS